MLFRSDTEARRALHYADEFDFLHMPFGAPFGPLDYLAAVEVCQKAGASVIVVDSTSHMHEGPGGLLEMHDAEATRLCKGDESKYERLSFSAWAEPKAQQRKFINAVLQMPVNFIFCFRAKDKLKPVPGRAPKQMGFQQIGADEFIYEMTVNALLLPGCNGHPTWQSDYEGERLTMKLPRQFRGLMKEQPQLNEDVGQVLAEWAAGVKTAETSPALVMAERYWAARTPDEFTALESERQNLWNVFTAPEKRRVKAASDEAKARIVNAEFTAPAEPTDTAN